MNYLGQTITETQRHAASLCTDLLRTAIHDSLHSLDAAIDHLYAIPPGAGNADEVFNAAGEVIATALMTALYVRELTIRPAPRFTRVSLSAN
jgi:hypothetical protein